MWWFPSVSPLFISSQCFSEGCIEHRKLLQKSHTQKTNFFSIFDSHNANLKQNYASHIYWTYDRIDAPKKNINSRSYFQSFKLRMVFPYDLRTSLRWAHQYFVDFEEKSRINFEVCMRSKAQNRFKISFKKLIWNEYFFNKTFSFHTKYKFEFWRCDDWNP